MWVSKENTVTDIDGNVYRTVVIENQIWMAENLKVTHYRNGDAIPNVTGSDPGWVTLITGAYCSYDNNDSNIDTYGLLYNWYALDDSRGLAPAGWHIPSDAEWTILVNYLGGQYLAGGKLKETGTTHWQSPNTGATNETEFSGLPGGYRAPYDGDFEWMGYEAHFWTATENSVGNAWRRKLYYSYSGVGHEYLHKRTGLSIRCIRD